MPTGETTFLDANGDPLAGGQVYFYIPNTTSAKDTWQNSGQSILNPNPVTLDSGGRAIIYGSGAYRQVVQDVLGNLIWDQETSEPNAGSVSFGGTSAGTANAQTLSAAQFSFGDGQIISFVAGVTNTGATTISIGGGSPIPILKNGNSGPVPLAANDIVSGNSYFIQYSAATASFQLLLSVAPALPTGAFLQGYLFGLTLSNNGADATNSIDFSVGSAASDGTTPVLMTNSSVFTKALNVNWTAGTAGGMLDTGAVANNTYHLYIIQRSDTGNVDFLASLSATTPTMPANYDRKRRIGSIIRTSAAIDLFFQNGDTFLRASNTLSYSAVLPFPNGLFTITNLPAGIIVQPIMFFLSTVTNGAVSFFVGNANGTSPQILIGAVSGSGVTSGASATGGFWTNTSRQVRILVSTSGSVASTQLYTAGWIDSRGRVF